MNSIFTAPTVGVTTEEMKKRVSFMMKALMGSLKSQNIEGKFLVTVIARNHAGFTSVLDVAGITTDDNGDTIFQDQAYPNVEIQFISAPLNPGGFTDVRGFTRLFVLIGSDAYDAVLADNTSRILQSLFFSLAWASNVTHLTKNELLIPVDTKGVPA